MSSIISRFSSRFGFAKSVNKIFARGGIIAVGNDSTYHIFTGPGSFVVTSPSEFITAVEYLIVAGGGGCGTNPNFNTSQGAGGGAGGLRTGSTSVFSGTSYPISVGTGGGAGVPKGSNGNSSSAFSITSAGGGGGGTHGISNGVGSVRSGYAGGAGGSGGGGGGAYSISLPGYTAGGGAGGAGNSPPVSPPQGSSGAPGDPSFPSNPYADSGGGGGAGGSGISQNGGPGTLLPTFPISIIGPLMPQSWLSVVSVYGFSRGGNGSNPLGSIPYSVGSSTIPNTIANTGYGAHSNISPGAGSPGIVIVRYSNRIGINTV